MYVRTNWSGIPGVLGKGVASSVSKLGGSVYSTVSSTSKRIFDIKDDIDKKVDKLKKLQKNKVVSKVLKKAGIDEKKVSKTLDAVSTASQKITDLESTGLDLDQEEIKKQASKELESVSKDISGCKKTLQGVQSGISKAKKVTGTFRKAGKPILAPIKAMEAAVKVIKALPMPQMYLPVSFTVLEVDQMEKLLELIKSAKDQVESIESMADIADSYLTQASKDISKVDGMLASLQACSILSIGSVESSDKQKLQTAGLVDEAGKDIFGKIIDASKDEVPYILWGNLETGSITDPKASIQDVSDDLSYSSEDGIQNRITLGKVGDEFDWGGRKVSILDPNNIDKGCGIIPITGTYEDYIDRCLLKLSKLTLSEDLQELLGRISYQPVEKTYTETKGNVVNYLAANGENYTLEIKIDTKSPTVATRHYVEARDSSGTVVLEGPPTFSLNIENLIRDMEVRLDLITL